MITRLKVGLAAAIAAVLGLGGCWGGGDDDSPSQASLEVPDSARASSAAFVSYIQTLSSSDEGAEPLIIRDSFALPADDDSDPIPLT